MLRTPFYEHHLRQGANMVDFVGWEMPLHYGSIIEEHHQVRNAAGLFDVSHMGRLKLTGSGARRLIERTCTRYVTDMDAERCRYSLVCNEQGGVLDDIIIYRFNGYWLLVVNASNRQKIVEHLNAQKGDLKVQLEDQTMSTAMVAIQGPNVMAMIDDVADDVSRLKRYAFCQKELLLAEVVISRTGYTGEDGIEVILPANSADAMFDTLQPHLESGELRFAGLGCRDTLRIEAGMPLYGHELSEDRDPLAAGLGFAVTLDKDQRERGESYIGQDALKQAAVSEEGQRLVALHVEGRRTPRQGAGVTLDGEAIGTVTSGCLSPTLQRPIAMAYLDKKHADALQGGDAAVDVAVGSKTTTAKVGALPFYKAKK